MLDTLLISTGGTIDKLYFDSLSEYQVGESAALDMLNEALVMNGVRHVEAFRKDSLELTSADRAHLRKVIELAPERQIVITHGTDTMVETGNSLRGLSDKVIVLTGALAPARFARSDATFNLGMAIAAVQVAAPGVWIAMSGTIFPVDRVRKDRARNAFVWVDLL